jgi:surface protein
LNVNDSCENSSGEVDENGCDPSQKDDDNDGFNNAIDQCPNTPSHELVEVDSNGCKINYIYIENGTVKAYPETPVGKQDVLFEQVNQFINYNGSPQVFTVVSRGELIDKIRNEEYLDNLVTSKITNMSSFFHSSYYDGVLPEINGNLSAWDVSNVTSFAIMFLENQEAHKLVLIHWDTSSATNTFGMFRKSSYGGVFNQIYSSKLNKISNWDVSNVTDMGFMFDSTYFDHDISSWDVSKVTRMKKMFYNNQYFNISIGGWDVSNVTDMSEMFAHPYNFGGGFNKDISDWNVSNVTDCTDFDLNSNNNWTDSNKPNFTNCNPD